MTDYPRHGDCSRCLEHTGFEWHAGTWLSVCCESEPFDPSALADAGEL